MLTELATQAVEASVSFTLQAERASSCTKRKTQTLLRTSKQAARRADGASWTNYERQGTVMQQKQRYPQRREQTAFDLLSEPS